MTLEEKMQSYRQRLAEEFITKLKEQRARWNPEKQYYESKIEMDELFLAGIEAGERLGLLRGKIEAFTDVSNYFEIFGQEQMAAYFAGFANRNSELLESLLKEGSDG